MSDRLGGLKPRDASLAPLACLVPSPPQPV